MFIKFKKILQWVYEIVYTKQIFVLINSDNIILTAYIKKQIIDYISIDLPNTELLSKYHDFLQKYQKFYISFILDNNLCRIKHELLPPLQSVLKNDPAKNFINENFSESDIVAYYVWHKSNINPEIWHIIFSYSPYQYPLKDLLNYVLEKAYKFSGIYFSSLEWIPIINNILQSYNEYTENNGYLQIFTYLPSNTTIKFLIKHNDNILSSKEVKYSEQNSNLYIQGILEQAISDILIFYKRYIQEHSLRTCVILATDEGLNELLTNANFPWDRVICITNNELKNLNNTECNTKLIHLKHDSSKYSSIASLNLFAKNKRFLGLNTLTKQVSNINLLNFLLFQPLKISILLLMLCTLYLHIQLLQNNNNKKILEAKYQNVIQNYQKEKSTYPSLATNIDLVQFYIIKKLLLPPEQLPLNSISSFFNSINENISIEKMNWILLNNRETIISPTYSKIIIELKLRSNKDLSQTMIKLNEYITQLQKIFTEFDLVYKIFDNKIVSLSSNHHIILPFQIEMTKKITLELKSE